MLKRINYRSLFANTWVMVGMAVALAGGVTWITYRYITASEARIKAEAESRTQTRGIAVVVPRADVPAGTPLSSDVFVAREIESDLVYDDMLRVDDFEQFRLATLARPVRRGRPLRAADIDALRARDFSDIVPAGMRALTLQIDTVNSTDSMLRPGNRVDLYWLGKNPDPLGKQSSSGDQAILLLMPDVTVLATGNDTRARDAGEAARDGVASEQYSTVTLQVPVADAARIVLAQKVGTLRLILRNSDDRNNAIPGRLDEKALFATVRRDESAPDAAVIELITGGDGRSSTSLLAVDPAGHADVATEPGRADNAVPPARRAPAPASPDARRDRHSAYRQANALAKKLQAESNPAGVDE
ncbi:Flp pilus assembly protein CpaB [Burkholderia cenocepacia]|uniref:Flp pilus assembly protein CpaB n=1 Tax=Burkholderia cenocepacia TaxID=95486 RepID=UPI00264EA9AF|nr:Flp pilus assembly protein CpaB [Burkholderia cenocepacia]MDN7452309.1 Flp pilus assembly protein CpaB [Burkholderia cenocepacia]